MVHSSRLLNVCFTYIYIGTPRTVYRHGRVTCVFEVSALSRGIINSPGNMSESKEEIIAHRRSAAEWYTAAALTYLESSKNKIIYAIVTYL